MPSTHGPSVLLPLSLLLVVPGCGGGGGAPPDAGPPDARALRAEACPGDPGCPDEGDGAFLAGAAAVDITPTDLLEGPSFVDSDGNAAFSRSKDEWTDADGDGSMDAVWIAGFSMSRPAMGVHDPIEARIVALRHNETTVVLVSADLVGYFYDALLELEASLPAGVAGQIDHIVWSSTHNHEGPDTMGMWGRDLATSGIDPGYFDHIEARVGEGIAAALADLRPASLTHGSILVEGDGGDLTHLFADGRDPVVINNRMNVLRFADAAGETIATLVNLGTHPEVLWSGNMQLTSDFAGYLRDALEDGVPGHFEGLGGVAVYLQGTCGGLVGPGHVRPLDLEGNEVASENSWEAAQAFGETFARAAVQALAPGNGAVADPAPFLRFRSQELYLSIDNYVYHAAYILGLLDRGLYHYDEDQPIDDTNVPDLLSEIVYLQVGLSSMITVPGELAPESFIGCYDGACSGGWDLVNPGNDNPPDLTAAPGPPYLRDVLAGDGSQLQWLIGLGQDEVGYILPDYDYQLSEDSPYFESAPGDHYCETNSLGPHVHGQVIGAATALVEGSR